LPFAQLLEIDKTVRKAIKGGLHGPGELYMDKNFFYSLALDHHFEKDACVKGTYRAPLMTQNGSYYVASCRQILDNIRTTTPS